MKNFTLIMVLIFLGLSNATAVAQGSWTLQTNPTAKTGESMQFVSATEGWVSLTSNQLLHTTNAGSLWTTVTPNATKISSGAVDAPGSRISFINASTGWVLKTLADINDNFFGAVLYKTTNGGASWNRTVLSNVVEDAGVQVQFVDANNGWVLIFNMNSGTPTFLKTTDGGATWTTTNGGGIFYYVNATTGYSFSAGPNMLPPYTIYKTTDGGTNWTPQLVDNTAGELSAIQFTDVNNGWVVGKKGKIFHTTNGGTNWTQITNSGYNINFDNNALSFINSTTGWIASKNNSDGSRFTLSTTDGGSTWTSQTLPFSNKVYSMDFWDANNGWAASEFGPIAKYDVFSGTYSNATFNGPWFVYSEPLDPYNDNLNYFVFDGNGNITAMNGFPSPITGTYSVNASGAFSGILNADTGYPFSGQLTSASAGTGSLNGVTWKFHKIANPGALKDKIEGTITSGGTCGSRNITLNIDNSGQIISATGITAPVSGRVYADLGVFIGHMTSGEQSNGWHEFTISGYYNSSNNSLTGKLQMDMTSCNTGTSLTMFRSNNQPVSTEWTTQTNPLNSRMCGAIKFVSATQGWMSISPGGLIHTLDGGTNWTETLLNNTDVIWSLAEAPNVSFINPSTGWVLKSFGTEGNSQGVVVYKTNDGGATWQRKVLSQTTGDFGYKIQFVDANNGWLIIFNFTSGIPTYLKTTDGGNNWNPTSGQGIFYYTTNTTGWAFTAGFPQTPPFTIYKTINGGANWTPQFTDNSAGHLQSIYFSDSNNGWIVGLSGKIYKTTDGGTNWIKIINSNLNANIECTSVYFLNSTTGWVGCTDTSKPASNFFILHTTDGGQSWTSENTSITTNNYWVVNIFFWDQNNGWLTTDNGAMARYSGTLNVKENIATKFITIYPNPNNGTFYFSLKEAKSKVKAEIYTLSGQKVFEASNFEMQPQNEVNFAPQSKGIYLIKITDGVNSYSEKIMIK